MAPPNPSDITATLRTVYADAADRVIAVDPDWPLLRSLVDFLPRTARAITTDLLIADAVRNSLTDDFAVATRVAEFTNSERTRLAKLPDTSPNRLMLSERRATAFVRLDDALPIHTTNPAVTGDLFNHYARLADDAPEIDLRIPGRAELLETAEQQLSTEFRADLEAVLNRAESSDRRIDAVALNLLLAAKHEVLLFDLGRWAEDIGLASKASISRKKATFEDWDLVRTEKVPSGIGRPRLRLLLGSECDNGDVDLMELVSLASGLR